ncbi:ArsA family ATPase [Haliangium ochraceum]|uniref:arsenite-transporting ATPase n=1 Tax=Haliangium ochraceum (strain DSM 14365 / JCM 11303 / SMP-2) TaxID=502025 RepID=D0LT16_HALO1|nr:ArsA-related P-loop ATPase [Haliangium ochraceum]ACY19152.1 adventurous gliding motility protein R [Haliangium ochraceum DSM 14365]
MTSNLADILATKRILVCVGSGGVGKTTTAAALSLEAALSGRRTLVLTIDPAKRLANSLGLEALGHEVQEVPEERLAAAGARRKPGGSLHAMMLDQKRAFDEVVARHASDPAAVQRILSNPVYAQISGSLAGSQEYAAMAKLHEFDAEGGFDLIVVDTPPTAHALDFLDAPEKLTNAIDSPAIEWFRRLRDGGGGGWSVVGKTGSYVFKRLAQFVGSRFLDDLAVFFTEFNDVLGGFRLRAEETFSLLRRDYVGFVLVASPETMAIAEARGFYERLRASKMPFCGFVINKVHEDLPIARDRAALAAAAAQVPAVAALGLEPAAIDAAIAEMMAAHAEIQVLAHADEESISGLVAHARSVSGQEPLLTRVPFFREDIHSLERLAELGAYLVS